MARLGNNEEVGRTGLKRALALTMEALDLVDGHDGPPEAAAHLSVAVHQLREAIRALDD